MPKLKKKLFYTLGKYSRQILRDITKWIILAPAGVCLKKKEPEPLISEFINKKRHMVILRPDGIGDFVVFAREFHRYRNLYPTVEWKITLVGNKIWQPLAEDWNSSVDNKWFDEFFSIDRKELRKSFKYRKIIASGLKSLKCDELIYPVHSRDVWGSVFVQWIDAKMKIAPFGDSANLFAPFKYFFDKSFTQLVPELEGNLLEVDRADYFIRILGDKSSKDCCFLSFPVTPKMQEEKKAILSKIGLRLNDAYVVVFPGASWVGKRWPITRFVEWGKKKKKENSKLSILVCGGPDEILLGKAVAEGIGIDTYNIVGQTTLIGLAGLVSGAVECIGNDTAVIHLSTAFGKITTCVLGGGHWGRFWPYGDFGLNQTISHYMTCFGCGWICIYKRIPVPCVDVVDNNND